MILRPFLRAGGLLCALALAAPATLVASDHADTAANFNRPGADMADVFIFPSPINTANVVMVMDVHPLIPAGQAGPSFDPNVLYQFKIDTTGDYVEDLVFQARFSGTGATQRVVVSGPYKPYTTGTTAVFARPYPTTGLINTTFSPTPGMSVFAGVRSDPFFFDLAQFFAILPDRQTPGTGMQVDNPGGIMGADTPQTNGFRGFPAGSGYNTSPASDLLASFNVLSIIVEMPKTMIGTGKIGLWETTSVLGGAPSFNFTQQDRLARPAVNEVLATVTANRHMINNSVNPTQDSTTIKNDILAFMNFPAGRSAATANTLAAVLVPDVMVADLSQNDHQGGLPRRRDRRLHRQQVRRPRPDRRRRRHRPRRHLRPDPLGPRPGPRRRQGTPPVRDRQHRPAQGLHEHVPLPRHPALIDPRIAWSAIVSHDSPGRLDPIRPRGGFYHSAAALFVPHPPSPSSSRPLPMRSSISPSRLRSRSSSPAPPSALVRFRPASGQDRPAPRPAADRRRLARLKADHPDIVDSRAVDRAGPVRPDDHRPDHHLLGRTKSAKTPQGYIAYRELAGAYLARQREVGDIADAVRAEEAARQSLRSRRRTTPARRSAWRRRCSRSTASPKPSPWRRPPPGATRRPSGSSSTSSSNWATTPPRPAACQAIATEPDDMNLLALQARFARSRGSPTRSLQLLRDAAGIVDLRPDMPAEVAAWCHTMVGHHLIDAGHLADGEKACEKALTIFPNDYRAMTGMAEAAAWRGDHAGALQWATAAIRLAPQNPEALRLAGEAAAGMGRTDEADAAVPGPPRPRPLVPADLRPALGALLPRPRPGPRRGADPRPQRPGTPPRRPRPRHPRLGLLQEGPPRRGRPRDDPRPRPGDAGSRP